MFAGPAEQAGTAGGGGAPKGLAAEGQRARARRAADTAATSTRPSPRPTSIVEGEFRTQVQTHAPLETHGVVADWKPRRAHRLRVDAGHLAASRDELAAVFDLPKSKVRVITEFMGGGFGAKFGVGQLRRARDAPVEEGAARRCG